MKSRAKDSVFAAALEQAARSILMNTALRREAGPQGVELAQGLLAGKRLAVAKDSLPPALREEPEEAKDARREATKWRNIARIRGASAEGQEAAARAAALEKHAASITAAVIASRLAWAQEATK